MAEDLQRLKEMEQQLTRLVGQKQQFERQVMEFDNAISELSTVDSGYQIVGSVMIRKDAQAITADLEKRKEIAEVRVKSFENQKQQLQEEVSKLQEKVMTDLDKE